MKYLVSSFLKTRVTCSIFAIAIGAISPSVMAFDYPEPGDFALGAQQWANTCAGCHNLRGPEDLRDDQWITVMYHMRIRAGLTGQETRNVLTFLQASNNTRRDGLALSPTEPDIERGSVLSGKAIYDQTCVVCHGSNGKGAIPGAPDLSDKSGRMSQSDDVLLLNVIRGFQSPGSSMAMPAKGGNPNLTEGDIRSVIEYLRSEYGA